MSFSFSPEPSADVTRYIRNKGLKPGFSWQDVWGDEHAHSFTVAKAMQLDVLGAIKGSLEKAQAEGKPFAQWQRELKPELQRLGWWGQKIVTDPVSGGADLVQLGSPRRLKTIYRANIRTANAAGQYSRAQRTKRALPFFLYELGPSENHRPHHVTWSGFIAPVDHPIWDTLFPPNGWGCKCRLRQISRAEATRLGYSEEKIPVLEYDDWINPRTGTVSKVARGVDPGWGNNPGKAREKTLHNMLNQRLVSAPPEWSATALRDLQESFPETFRNGFAAWTEDILESTGRNKEIHAVGVLSEKTVKAASDLPLSGNLVVIDGGRLFHLVDHPKAQKGKTVPRAMITDLPAILEKPDQILIELKPDGSKGNLVFVKSIPGEREVARIIVQPGRTSRAADSAQSRAHARFNTVISASRVDPREFKEEKRYLKIEE